MAREIVQVVEFVQPLCANLFGVAPCVAGGEPCFRTRKTCRSWRNFALGDGLSLFFTRGDVAERNIAGVENPLPFLVSVSTTPTKINLSASSTSATGLGNRATASIVFRDGPHSDRIVDMYRDQRNYEPEERGTFWGEWLARNPYRYQMKVRVYEGLAGQALSEMTVRSFVLTDIGWPSASGRVTATAKDVLALAEERKAPAVEASPGILEADIAEGDTSLTVLGATVDDYPEEVGTIRIDNELMTYTARSGDANGLVFSGIARGTDNTTAASHSAEETVQRGRRMSGFPDELVWQLLDTADIGDYFDVAGGAAERTEHLSTYYLSTVLSDPAKDSVIAVLAELCRDCGFRIWWDERRALIRFKAETGLEEEAPILTEEEHICADSLSIKALPASRISQCWIRIGLRSPVLNRSDVESFRRTMIVADLPSESVEKHGEKSVRVISSRWLQSEANAYPTANKLVTRHSEIPRQATFEVDVKDTEDLWTGDVLRLSHSQDLDEFGARNLAVWTIVQAEMIRPAHRAKFVCVDTTNYGVVYRWQGDDAPNYPGKDAAPFAGAYWGDDDGLLSDGSPAARWS